jgi:hypothetical protein
LISGERLSVDMADGKAPSFKSEAAREALVELLKIAGMDRDRIANDILTGKGHSEYERAVLKMNLAQAYQAMVAKAYETAMEVESKAMALSAQVAYIAGQ